MLRYFDFTMCTPANKVFSSVFVFFFWFSVCNRCIYRYTLYECVACVWFLLLLSFFCLLTSSSTLLSHHRTYIYATLLYSSVVHLRLWKNFLQFSNSNFTHSGDDEMDYICIGMSTGCCQMQRKLVLLHNQNGYDMDNATILHSYSATLFTYMPVWLLYGREL